jgi:NADH dehydrogenase FAD-containing subunit
MSQRKQLVLIGAGHAHLYIARRAAQFVRHGIRVVLIDPGRFWYSGLATGMLGGMYDPRSGQVEPKMLIEQQGGLFVRDRVVMLARDRRELQLASGRTVPYDLVSLNIGSEVSWDLGPMPVENVWTAKPISGLWDLRQYLERGFSTRASDVGNVLVIGGGPTGCELAANVDALAHQHQAAARITIVTRGTRLAEAARGRVSQVLMETLRRRGIEVVLDRAVTQLSNGLAVLDDGRRLLFDAAIVATGLRPSRDLAAWGFRVDDQGGLRVDATLRSLDDDAVFGAGDCISLERHFLPRLGVFAVRQSPILLHNLWAAASGGKLRTYRPQKRHLTILNLGRGQGLATWGRLYWCGRSSLWLKGLIDRRFLAKYQIRPIADGPRGRV